MTYPINFEKISKISNRQLIDFCLTISQQKGDFYNEKILKLKPTNLSINDRIDLEKYLKINKLIANKLFI